MTSFEQLHADRWIGKLETCDRILFKGHLTRLYWPGGFLGFTCALRVRLTDLKEFVSTTTDGMIEHAKEIAAKAKRPYIYLDRPMTAKTGLTRRTTHGVHKVEQVLDARRFAARENVVRMG